MVGWLASKTVEELFQNGPKILQDRVAEAPQRQNLSKQSPEAGGGKLPPHFEPQSLQTGSKIGSKMEPKSMENRGCNRCKMDDRFWMPF